MLTKVLTGALAVVLVLLLAAGGMLKRAQATIEKQSEDIGKYKVAVEVWENSYNTVVMEIDQRDRKVEATLAEREALSSKAADLKNKLDEERRKLNDKCGKVLTPQSLVDVVLRNANKAAPTEAVSAPGSATHNGDTSP